MILPLLRPSLLAAALLVFLFDFTSFGVILLLGGSKFATLEVEIYLRVPQTSQPFACRFVIGHPTSLHDHLLGSYTHVSSVTTTVQTRAALCKLTSNPRPSTKILRRCSLSSSFLLLHPPACLPPYPFPLPPRSGPWSARRSPIWLHV